MECQPGELATIRMVWPFTKISPERICGLVDAVKYVVQHGIFEVFVECGVWRGGSMMAVARMLVELGETSRAFTCLTHTLG